MFLTSEKVGTEVSLFLSLCSLREDPGAAVGMRVTAWIQGRAGKVTEIMGSSEHITYGSPNICNLVMLTKCD